ncbi:hypothetical protein SAMN05216308_101498 [Nitrosospira sp. Nsp13]|jgi:hypothetical protein|nr:hypothetical protein SAMN05216308_101498 [Nitrosospira sp. Nsp13]
MSPPRNALPWNRDDHRRLTQTFDIGGGNRSLVYGARERNMAHTRVYRNLYTPNPCKAPGQPGALQCFLEWGQERHSANTHC